MTKYMINVTERTIVVTKAFAKEASILNSEAYNTLKTLHNDYPDFKFEQRVIKRNANKRTYRNLNYDKMESYIRFIENGNEAALEEFENVKRMASFKSSPYSYTKKWFLDKYKDFSNEEAVSEIA